MGVDDFDDLYRQYRASGYNYLADPKEIYSRWM
jgi:hypothetical protein